MKILKKKKKNFFFFLRLGFFFQIGKKSPKSHCERGRISAPEDTKKKIPADCSCRNSLIWAYIVYLYTYVYHKHSHTGPRSAVGNVSGYRCVSDCRSRGRKFDPDPVTYFRGD